MPTMGIVIRTIFNKKRQDFAIKKQGYTMNEIKLERKFVDILVDANNNLAIFSMAKNPDKIEGDVWSPIWLPAQNPIELRAPYTAEELSVALARGINAWESGEVLPLGKSSLAEFYYQIKGFKKATLGTKYVNLGWCPGWGPGRGKYVWIELPMNRNKGHAYMGIEFKNLPDDADWMDFANTLLGLLDMDLTKTKTYQVYKSKLNK